MNLQLLTDLYEFSMANGYYATLPHDRQARFDVFYRRVPDNGSFVIVAGLQQVVEQIQNWHFTKENIEYLTSLNEFTPEFLDYLSKIKNHCSIKALPEGTPVFPREPIISISGPLIEAQLLETFILNIINHQSLIATKSWQINHAAQGRPIMEFGARRAQGPDAATYGARAAVIGGCTSTSNLQAASKFNIPAAGTMAHAWVESFSDELSAFQAWAKVYPDKVSLLVDTYDVLKSGVPNAIRVFKQVSAQGHQPVGIRIDSGDISQLAIKARKMLDEAGFPDAVISASNDLDEYLIDSLKVQGCKITSWGVGTHLITSKDWPSFGGVYKLAAIQDAQSGEFIPKIKLSENSEKITNPGNKKIYRIYEKDTGKIKADLICLADEIFDPEETMIIFDPVDTWKKTKVLGGTYELRELLIPVIREGKRIYTSPEVMELRKYCQKEQETLWDESRRLVNPHGVYVDLSQKLYDMKISLLNQMSQV